eukprot:GHVH01016439.1.p1 GENE.GHVH01016439.1~~GHVH01016439.1.p1  ORF type:complete len:324 (+),score=45.51 GHVH01016439.1:303-1274(+)
MVVLNGKSVDDSIQYHESARPRLSADNPFFSAVGNTPLLKITEHIYAKLETYNPTGSLKDRMICGLLRSALIRGELTEDTVLVEATSGNTGIALSAAGAALGLPVEIFMPQNMSESRKTMMRLYGAQLHLVGDNDFLGAIRGRDEKIATDTKKYWSPMQFSNENNTKAHMMSTCPEIVQQLASVAPDKKWECIIQGSGTGGTISAFCQHRKALNLDYKIVMTEPLESPDTHGIQGIYDGADFLMDRKDIDYTWKVSTQAATERAMKFAKDEGILVGISSGANLLLAERYVKEMNPEGAVVTILCDRGERYSDTYMDILNSRTS